MLSYKANAIQEHLLQPTLPSSFYMHRINCSHYWLGWAVEPLRANCCYFYFTCPSAGLRVQCLTYSLLQVIEPNQVDSTTGNVLQTMENVSNFINALQRLQFPTSAIFSIADIDSAGWEDRCWV